MKEIWVCSRGGVLILEIRIPLGFSVNISHEDSQKEKKNFRFEERNSKWIFREYRNFVVFSYFIYIDTRTTKMNHVDAKLASLNENFLLSESPRTLSFRLYCNGNKILSSDWNWGPAGQSERLVTAGSLFLGFAASDLEALAQRLIRIKLVIRKQCLCRPVAQLLLIDGWRPLMSVCSTEFFPKLFDRSELRQYSESGPQPIKHDSDFRFAMLKNFHWGILSQNDFI